MHVVVSSTFSKSKGMRGAFDAFFLGLLIVVLRPVGSRQGDAGMATSNIPEFVCLHSVSIDSKALWACCKLFEVTVVSSMLI